MEETARETAATDVALVVKHNAKFTKSILHMIAREIQKEWQARSDADADDEGYTYEVLDPFGGIGGIFDVREYITDYDDPAQLSITCIELEQEWASQGYDQLHYDDEMGDRMVCADFLKWATPTHKYLFDIVATSCTYGNRMADHHDAKDGSKRNTYKHTLGRDLSENNSGGMQWGDEYRQFHHESWQRVFGLLTNGGLFILNVKDHIRKGKRQPVSAWHKTTCKQLGFELIGDIEVPVRGNRQGENHEARVDVEHVFLFRKPYTLSLKYRAEQFPELRSV